MEISFRRPQRRFASPLVNNITHRGQHGIRWNIRWPAIQASITPLLHRPPVDHLGNAPLRSIDYESIPVKITPATFPSDLSLDQLTKHTVGNRRDGHVVQHIICSDLGRQGTTPTGFTARVVQVSNQGPNYRTASDRRWTIISRF